MANGSISHFKMRRSTDHIRTTLAVYADDEHCRNELVKDGLSMGLATIERGDIDLMMGDGGSLIADIVICRLPIVDARHCAALSRFDRQIADDGKSLIICTEIEFLDKVYGCFSNSSPHVLVAGNRSQRLLALGIALGRRSEEGDRLREPVEQPDAVLLRLTDEISRLAQKLDSLTMHDGAGEGRLASPKPVFHHSDYDASLVRKRPSAPDPGRVRQIIRRRKARALFFDAELFADPAWDMLLDLTAARGEGKRVSVTSLCIAAEVPTTTALRWIGQLIDAGILIRMQDPDDRRRAFIELSDRAADAMARYFAAAMADQGPAL